MEDSLLLCIGTHACAPLAAPTMRCCLQANRTFSNIGRADSGSHGHLQSHRSTANRWSCV